MQQDDELLGEVLEALTQLRADLHGSTESSAVRKIDAAIEKLRELQRDESNHLDRATVLMLIGLALEAVPAVASILDYLSRR
jgi:hypothetical protein